MRSCHPLWKEQFLNGPVGCFRQPIHPGLDGGRRDGKQAHCEVFACLPRLLVAPPASVYLPTEPTPTEQWQVWRTCGAVRPHPIPAPISLTSSSCSLASHCPPLTGPLLQVLPGAPGAHPACYRAGQKCWKSVPFTLHHGELVYRYPSSLPSGGSPPQSFLAIRMEDD